MEAAKKKTTTLADELEDIEMGDDNEANEGSQADENEGGTKSGIQTKKKNKETFPALNRPIIMVCNDGFARALAPLKEIILR